MCQHCITNFTVHGNIWTDPKLAHHCPHQRHSDPILNTVQTTAMNTTLTAEKVADRAVMLCDALYMNIKEQQIRSHQRSIDNEINMDYHKQKIEEILDHGPDVEFYVKTLRKYYKIVFKDAGGQQSVHAFVDRENGDLYKPASWRAPAKIARYNLLNEEHTEWLYQNADWSGGYLYLK